MIRLEQVAKEYRTRSGERIVAIETVTFDVEQDEFITVVGPSGCGKSTLLKLVGALVAPSSGRILLRGRPLDGHSPDVGIVFQSPVLLPWRSVIDNIMFPIEILRRPTRKYLPEAERLIALVGLKGFERAMPYELSGGMQQRVAICRALIHDPPLLLMDEPFGALDAMTREELGFELLRVWNERKKTVMFVTHSIPEAILLADRVFVMTARPGRIVATIAIKLPRPRSVVMESTPEFIQYAETIRNLVGRRTG